MGREAEINLKVMLDEKQMPEKITWDATDSQEGGYKECAAILVSLWNAKSQEALSIDLWTKDMMVSDMNILVHQTLLKLEKIYTEATSNNDGAEIIGNCAKSFAEKLRLVKYK